jgi:hypothetical protein
MRVRGVVFVIACVMLVGCAHHHGALSPLPSAGTGNERNATAVTAAAGVVSNYVPIHAYMGNGTGGCIGAQPATSVIQSVMRIVQSCAGFDPGTVCPQTQAPPPGAPGCLGEHYLDATMIGCNLIIHQTWFQQEDGTETAFLHNTSPIAQTNRIDGTSATFTCPAPGTTTPSNYFYWSNPADSSNIAFWVTNFFENGPIASRHYILAMMDQMEPGRPYAGGEPVEFPTLSAWRTGLGTFMSSLSDAGGTYPVEANIIGWGGGNFPGNNKTGALEAVVNEAIDITDVCDGDTAGNDVGYISERPWEEGNGTRLLIGGNPKILVNTASQLWSDPNCKGNLEQLNAADTLTLRMVTKAMEFIMSPPNAQGTPGGQAITEWRYPIGVTTQAADVASEVPVFPEDLLVMVNPVTPLRKWQWSGSYDGGGCANNGTTGQLAPDTGGTHDVTLARACGTVGTWDGGYPAPVYYREGTCYKQGTLLGPCGAAIDLGTKSLTLHKSDFVNGARYHHYLAPTGGELPADPVTGGTICTAANCNGAWGMQSLPKSGSSWKYNLPSCIPPSPDPGTYQNSSDCAVVLLP